MDEVSRGHKDYKNWACYIRKMQCIQKRGAPTARLTPVREGA